MKSRVLKNISTQIYLLSPHLGVAADKVENHQAVSSVWKGYLSNSLPPPTLPPGHVSAGVLEIQGVGSWGTPRELDFETGQSWGFSPSLRLSLPLFVQNSWSWSQDAHL